jgi:hypothetical protein
MNKLSVKLLDIVSPDDGQLIEFSIEIGGSSKILFKGKVDYPRFFEWIMENETEIRLSELPFDNSGGESIAEKMHYFYEELDVDNDELVDAMYDYRSSHCLRFASRGSDFPEIYIGKSTVCHEVSIFNEHEKWQYNFNVDDFFCNLQSC